MAAKAIVTTPDKTKDDRTWKDVAPSPPRRPEDVPDPKPQKPSRKT
jgi:hypothetical protein